MTLLYPSGVFTAVKQHFDDPRTTEHLRLPVETEKQGTLTLSIAEAHAALYGPDKNEAFGEAVWRAVIRGAREETGPDGPWQLVLVWLALPRLTGMAHRVCARLRVNRADVEGDLALGLMDALRTAERHHPLPIDHLISTAGNQAWRSARAARSFLPSADIELLARSRVRPGHDLLGNLDGLDTPTWEVDLPSVYRRDRLGAPLRFTGSAEQLEGERVGALADRLGLHDVVRRAVRDKRPRRIGTVSLRPRKKQR
ncbi:MULTISPECIES: hypothetical protein [unclassified Streptomyces]|uniref:hypothetical protein n=1 Tax=unclassified Streptomyces TaxID=2593676 RepID=UPI00166089F5|nr:MULTISPECIES: hypothetical protein [unclassified Streptomyces]MBD0711616.1 hypothetical protein [Streptomyces sp. CBMA291]MBD0714813.1 hypothetical protein [Streptomyces sp. CBMA370]